MPSPEIDPDDDDDDDGLPDADAVVVVEITDELDLHHFAPREVASLVTDYLDEARARGFASVRLIHGKGTGALRRTVLAVLDRHPAVAGHRPAGDREGGWGATVATLRPA